MSTRRLTEREKLILEMAIRGHCSREIAQDLGVTYSAIQKKWLNIYHKLQAANQAQAVYKATTNGLLKAAVILLIALASIWTPKARIPQRPTPRAPISQLTTRRPSTNPSEVLARIEASFCHLGVQA